MELYVSEDLDKAAAPKWQDQQNELIGAIEGTIRYYQRSTDRIILYQRYSSITTMIVGITAPIIVTATQAGKNNTELESSNLGYIAVAITAALSILDGLRRIFRYEQRWISCHSAMMALRQALGSFYFATVESPPGTQLWKDEMISLRRKFEDETSRERSVFYHNLNALDPVDQQPKKT